MVMRVIMTMSMIVMMVMFVVMGVIVRMHRRPFKAMFFAELFVTAGGIAIAVTGAIFHATANAFDMVVVAFLRQTNLCFKPQHLLTIFAHLAVHDIFAIECFFNAIHERINDQIMIVQITSFDELNIGMFCCNFIRIAVYPFHQNTGEKEVREHQNPFVPSFVALRSAGAVSGNVTPE